MKKLENIIENYQKIIRESEQELQKTRKQIRNISLLRLFLFIESTVAAFYFWDKGWEYILLFSVFPILLFFWLVKRHNRWFYRKDFLKKKIEINNQEIRAIRYDFSDFDGGKEPNICSYLISTFPRFHVSSALPYN